MAIDVGFWAGRFGPLVIGLGISFSLTGCYTQVAELNPSIESGSSGFGWSASLDGTTAIVGAPFRTTLTPDPGSAEIFNRDDAGIWALDQLIFPADGEDDDWFGWSVSLDGTWAAIGSPQDDDDLAGIDAGSAYLYLDDVGGWSLQQKLLASDGDVIDNFGWSISIDGSWCAVGAPGESLDAGAVYLFEWNGASWVERQKLLASDGEGLDLFGWSVSLDGDWLVVGAPGDESDAGAAYVFLQSGGNWQQQQKLIGDTADAGFGDAVSIEGTTLVVGAPQDDETAFQAGAAYVFSFDGAVWQQIQKLFMSNGATQDWFGDEVAYDAGSNTIVVGSTLDDLGPSLVDAGSAVVFLLNPTTGGWTPLQSLFADDGAADDNFGFGLATDGTTIMVGAPLHDGAGAEFVFEEE